MSSLDRVDATQAVAVGRRRSEAEIGAAQVIEFQSFRTLSSLRDMVRCSATSSSAGSGSERVRYALLAKNFQSSVESRSVYAGAKRVFDIVGSLAGMVLLAPLMAIVAIAIRFTSPGPVFFHQLRYGRDEIPFRIYKFRTFYVDQSDVSGRAQTVPNDSRVTAFGRLLRRTNIDELPQLWNVLKGDMSLVGPRPHAIGMRAAGMVYEDLVPLYHLRHIVKPGITGLAQVRGFRGGTTQRRAARGRVLLDLIYIERSNLLLDMRIVLATLVQEFRSGTGA